MAHEGGRVTHCTGTVRHMVLASTSHGTGTVRSYTRKGVRIAHEGGRATHCTGTVRHTVLAPYAIA
eukprot:4250925-Amphidinium_carterae.1